MRILKNHFFVKTLLHPRFVGSMLIFLLCKAGLAQQRLDSLEAVLDKSIPDSARVQTLLELSTEYEYVDVTKSRAYTEDAIRIIEEKKLTGSKARAYQNMGSIYRVGGNFQAALKADTEALEFGIASNDSASIATSYNNIANDYYDLGEYDEAYRYFTLSYRVASALRDSLTQAITIHNVGRVYKELGQYDRALERLQLSRQMSKRIGDTAGEPYSLSEIGDVLLRQGKYDSALSMLRKTLQLSRAQDLRVLLPKSMMNIAQILIKKSDYTKALAYYDTAYQQYSRSNDKYGIAEVNLGRGLAYASMKRYDDAMKLIQGSLEDARTLNAKILQLQCTYHLSSLWELRGDHKKALEYFKQYDLVEDSLFSQDMQSRLAKDQLQFETEDKDSQIAALSEQQARQKSEIRKQEFVRNILVVVMALSGILLLTVYRSGQRRRKINTLLLQHQEEMEKRSEELEKLNQVKDKFFSIISHDLRSPINALAGLLDLLDKGAILPTELPEHIKELRIRFHHTRTLLNNLLDWTLLQMDKLNLQATKIDVHRIAEENILLLGPMQGKDITIQNDIPKPCLAFADSNTINLVIRNLITNALKFTNDGGKVLIKATEGASEWQVSVHDNGIGMKPEVLKILFDKTAPYTTRGTANEKGTGLGLILCKEFVEKNGGRIWVESSEGKGSVFFFTLPKAVKD
jgi:signal transduction histidine kinase/predicted negative regulator of RcsB-dependent stress response